MSRYSRNAASVSMASALTWPPPLGGRDLDFLVGQRRHVEQLRNALAPFDLDQQHLAPAGRQRQRQRRRDRRLAGAALAGHEVQAGLRSGATASRPSSGARCGCHQRMLARCLAHVATTVGR